MQQYTAKLNVVQAKHSTDIYHVYPHLTTSPESFQSVDTVPALSLKDMAVDRSPALTEIVQLLLKQGSIRGRQLPDYLLPRVGQFSQDRLVADETFLQLL